MYSSPTTPALLRWEPCALLAAGIVIVYRANRIVNFAQAELGAVPANLALLLIAARHWNYFLAAGSGLAAAILL